MITWDTETRSFRWWENPAFLGSWTHDGEGEGSVAVLPTHSGNPFNLSGEFKRAILNDDHHVGANLKFDAHMGREAFGEEIVFKPGNKWDDVLMMSRLLYGQKRAGRHGLKDSAVEFIDPYADAAEKDMQEKYHELTGRTSMEYDDAFYIVWQAYPDVVERYAGLDAIYTRKLYDLWRPQIKADAKLERLYIEVEQPVMEVLYRAEEQGVHVDPAAVQKLTGLYAARDAAARAALQEQLGFVPEGEGSTDALRQALLGAGVPLTEVTEKTGELAVNQKSLAKFSDHPAVAALQEWRRVNKFLKTYINPLQDTDHIHPTFNQAEAWTGRMSGSSPNMQNLPKRTEVGKPEDEKIRSVFVPSPGMEFVIADFDSIEMRLLAFYIGLQSYRDTVDHEDPHAITAAAVWPALGDYTKFLKGTPNRWMRDIAKQATYAIVYGGGGRVIADTINKYVIAAGHPEFKVTEDEARAIRRKIADAIPGFKELTNTPWQGRTYPSGRLHQQLTKSTVDYGDKRFGYVRTLLGRKQWIQMWPEEKAYVALSAEIQGSAADVMKAAAINVYEAMKPYGFLPILFVHDELVTEVEKGWGERLKPIIVDAMTQAAAIDPPLRVEANVTARSYAHTD